MTVFILGTAIDAMTKGKPKVEKSSQQSPGEEGEHTENKRLKDRALSKGVFGRAKSDAENFLRPSKRKLGHMTVRGISVKIMESRNRPCLLKESSLASVNL